LSIARRRLATSRLSSLKPSLSLLLLLLLLNDSTSQHETADDGLLPHIAGSDFTVLARC
jgi:hypothetical protein